MFYISESAAIDPDDFAWLVFTRATKMRLSGYNQRHTLVLEKGDIFGVRRTRVGKYQLVKGSQMHILYRNISEKTHSNIMKNAIPYKGPTPSEQEVEDGFVRHRRVSTRETSHTPNKRTDDYYKPKKGRVVEKFEIDLNNYQWRRIKKDTIKVETKKQGKVRGVLHPNDLIGLRYQTPARGGYVIINGNVRVHITHELYTRLVHSSRVVPDSQQRTGTIDLETKVSEPVEPKPKKPLRKKKVVPQSFPEEEPVEKLYDFDSMEDEEILEKTKRRRKDQNNLRRAVRKLLEVPEQDVWLEDENEAFEPEDGETSEPQEDRVFDPDSEEGFDAEIDQDEKDAQIEDEQDEAEEEEDTTPVVESLNPGDVIQMKGGTQRKFVVVDSQPMERNENLVEYTLFDPDEGEPDEMYRLRLNIHMTTSEFEQHAEVIDSYDSTELKSLQDSADYATIKPVSLLK